MVSVCNAIMALSAETLIFLKRRIIMKKTFIIIAMAGILTAITGCGKTDSGITSDNNKTTTKAIVTTTAVTTAENTSTTSAKVDKTIKKLKAAIPAQQLHMKKTPLLHL